MARPAPSRGPAARRALPGRTRSRPTLSVLADALAELADPAADLARKAIEDELTLRLPGTPDGPLASPALIREPGAEPRRPGRAGRCSPPGACPR